MTIVLVVDDTAVDRKIAGSILGKAYGAKPLYAADGMEALAIVERQPPDVIVTDLQMPQMDGLQLVKYIRNNSPAIPVVLMTAHGSEEIAVQALHAGAASYVPKKNLAKDLCPTIDRVLTAASSTHRQQKLLRHITRAELDFCLDNDPGAISTLVVHVDGYLASMEFCDEAERVRIAIVLEETLNNALYHGNLELGSDLRTEDKKAYHKLAEERCGLVPYRGRRIHVSARVSPSEISFAIRDEGPGFDPATVPDPTDAANIAKPGGRGLLLIQAFMDEVTHNQTGNEIRMIKRRREAA